MHRPAQIVALGVVVAAAAGAAVVAAAAGAAVVVAAGRSGSVKGGRQRDRQRMNE